MVVERFHPDLAQAMADRFRLSGRMLPKGVEYQASWMASDGSCCYQLMAAPSRPLLDLWIERWNDIVLFEVIEIQTSQEYWSNKKG